MLDEILSQQVQVRSSNRRTRSERTKRRERYLRKVSAPATSGTDWCNQPQLHKASNGNGDNCRKCGQQLLLSSNGYAAVPSDSGRNKQQNQSKPNQRFETAKPKDHLYKILVIGDLGTGKTSIIKRYVHQFFTQHYRATIGVDFALKVINWDATTLIRLQLWDIAGQERFGNMTRVYYKEAVGTFIVFDVTRANTFESVANWKADLDSKVQLADGTPIPCVLLANKCDQPKEGIIESSAKMDKFCKEKGFVAWFETSAKENINIEEAAKALVLQILENDSVNNKNGDREQFSLASKTDNQNQSGKSCSC